MLVYTVRRLLAAIPVLLAASIFVFALASTFSDPLVNLLLQDPPPSPELIEAERERFYLDRSVPERYWLWLTGLGQTNGDIGLLQGKFGPSTRGTAFDIGEELGSRLATTLRLVLVATVAAIFLAIITGVVSAVRQYSKTDHTLTFVGFLALAMPVFWLAGIAKELGLFANRNLGTSIGTIGAASADTRNMTGWEQFLDSANHLVLPTLVLMLTGYAVISRYQRASMLEVLNSDYVRLARAKGLRNRVVMRRHALRTALIPVTTVSLLAVVATIDGVVITETVFQWNGLGRFFLDAIRRSDTFVVMGWLMLSGTLVVVANLIADLLYAVLDPRIRYE